MKSGQILNRTVGHNSNINNFNSKNKQSGRLIRDGKPIGKGTYGTVYRAFFDQNESPNDRQYGSDSNQVAVKRNIVDVKASFLVPVRELTILNRLRGHPFLVKLLTISLGNPFIKKFRSREGQVITRKEELPPIKDRSLRSDDLYFIFEHASHDCHTLIYDRDLTGSTIKLSMVQILLGIEYVHSQGIIHRDLKPSNLLFFRSNHSTTVKICDFGLSKHVTRQEPMTPRTVTAWYRAPEVVCRWVDYGSAIDCWSIGCIFFEFLTRKALFYRMNDDRTEIFNRMRQTLPANRIGQLDLVDVNNYFAHLRTGVKRWKSPTSWREIIQLNKEQIGIFNRSGKGGTYRQFLDMLDGLLNPDPRRRSTATQALNHPFFNGYRDYIDATRKIHPPVPDKSHMIKILDREERQQAIDVAFNIYNKRSEKNFRNWYTHRILFQAIDIFDRYLVWMDQKQISSGCQTPKPRLNKEQAEFRFMICLYLSMKLLTTTRIIIGFNDMVPDNYHTPHYLQLARSFESELITKVLGLEIYRNSIYEAADLEKNLNKLTKVQVRDLLFWYGKAKNLEGTASELLKQFLQHNSNLDRSIEPAQTYQEEVVSPVTSSTNSNTDYPEQVHNHSEQFELVVEDDYHQPSSSIYDQYKQYNNPPRPPSGERPQSINWELETNVSQSNYSESSYPELSYYLPSTPVYTPAYNQEPSNRIFKVGVEKQSNLTDSTDYPDISFSLAPSSACRPRMVRLDETGRNKIPLEQANLLIKV